MILRRPKIQLQASLISIFYLALVFEIINIAYYYYYFRQYHYLPSPFILDKKDTFMDFYHPLYWALKDQFYGSFKSVYPPINDVILSFFRIGISEKNIDNSFDLRQRYPNIILIVLVIYLFIIGVVTRLGKWHEVKVIPSWLICVVCALSVPVLFALERGNLIFLALLFLALYLNAGLDWKKAFFLAVLINIKPYFALLLIQYLNKYHINKRMIFYTMAFTIAIFFLFGLFTDINYIEFFKTYILFSNKATLSSDGVVSLAHNLSALSRIKELLYYNNHPHYNFWFSIFKVLSPLSVLFLVYWAIFKPLNSLELLVAVFIILTNFSVSTGGYILIIYIVLLPYLMDSKEYQKLILPILAIFTLPVDWVLLFNIPYPFMNSYLGGVDLTGANGDYWIAVGSVVRPILNYIILIMFLVHLLRKYPFLKQSPNIGNL